MDKLQHYEIAEKLGEGKHGPSFLAMDTNLQCKVVVKQLDHPITKNDEWKNQYQKRLEQLNQINNARLTKYHILEEADGHRFIVREHFEGKNLTEWIRTYLPTPARILKIALELTTQLKVLHDNGLVHGNITPANIIINSRGQAKLVDDGLGFNGDTWSKCPEALTGEIVYLAPELLSGGEPSPHSDNYALGALTYLMWTGQPVFPDDDPETLIRSIVEEPVSFELYPSREVPGVARLLISKLLAKDPDGRFVSTDELLFTLQEMIALGSEPEAPPSKKKWSPSPRQYLLVSVLAVLLVILWFVITIDRH
ncbi:MAG: serine/threonine protein kinase [candidate division Zixibacteria bacterium]|nr:serine/threonine protein kinase [candidate division Zixibacteria bacterium]